MAIAAISIAGASCGLLVTPAHLAVVKDFYGALTLPHGEGDHSGEQTRDPSGAEPTIYVDHALATFHPELRAEQDREEFEDRATVHALIVNETNTHWSSTVENDVATVEGRFTVEGVEVASGRFWLSQENDAWKIVAFRLEDESGTFASGTIPGSAPEL